MVAEVRQQEYRLRRNALRSRVAYCALRLTTSRGAMRSAPRRLLQARLPAPHAMPIRETIAASTASASAAPSASPFSKSCSAWPIVFVTWARHST